MSERQTPTPDNEGPATELNENLRKGLEELEALCKEIPKITGKVLDTHNNGRDVSYKNCFNMIEDENSEKTGIRFSNAQKDFMESVDSEVSRSQMDRYPRLEEPIKHVSALLEKLQEGQQLTALELHELSETFNKTTLTLFLNFLNAEPRILANRLIQLTGDYKPVQRTNMGCVENISTVAEDALEQYRNFENTVIEINENAQKIITQLIAEIEGASQEQVTTIM